MNILHFRVVVDNTDGVFRDIHIARTANFQSFHDAITKAFEFSGMEMASFYMSNDDWDKGEEIALMDIMVDPGEEPVRIMADTAMNELVGAVGDKMIYLYDFMRMWIFYVELIGVSEESDAITYPNIALSVGIAPAEDSKEDAGPMKVEMEEGSELYSEFGDDEDGEGYESYDDPYTY